MKQFQVATRDTSPGGTIVFHGWGYGTFIEIQKLFRDSFKFFLLSHGLWTSECRCAVPHNAGGSYSALIVINVSIKVKL